MAMSKLLRKFEAQEARKWISVSHDHERLALHGAMWPHLIVEFHQGGTVTEIWLKYLGMKNILPQYH